MRAMCVVKLVDKKNNEELIEMMGSKEISDKNGKSNWSKVAWTCG